jgi:hypothetical protein
MERFRASPAVARGLLAFALIVTTGASAYATSYGADITVFDNRAAQHINPIVDDGWWGGVNNPDPRIETAPRGADVLEDNETEPSTQWGQEWDLEGTYYDFSTHVLTVAGGFNFATGQHGWDVGDIFIATNQTLLTGEPTPPNTDGSDFDYVFHLTSFGANGGLYDVYRISGLDVTNGLVSVDPGQVTQSNPWRYGSNGTLLASNVAYSRVTFADDTAFSTALNPGIGEYAPVGGFHNVLTGFDLDLLGLPSTVTSIYTHFTMECGNDTLQAYAEDGGGLITPEPGTVGLLALALAGVGLRRKLAKR